MSATIIPGIHAIGHVVLHLANQVNFFRAWQFPLPQKSGESEYQKVTKYG